MFEICLGAHDGIIYIIYISEWYLIVMHPALCCWPCWWIWRKEKQNPGQGSEGSNSETQLRSTADSLCVPSFPCWAVQLDCFSVCAPLRVATVVWVCESEMCTAPVCVVVRWQIFWFVDCTNTPTLGSQPLSEWISISSVTKLFQHQNNVNRESRMPTDRCNKQARALSLCLHKHAGHMSQAPRWQAELFMRPVKFRWGSAPAWTAFSLTFFLFLSPGFLPCGNITALCERGIHGHNNVGEWLRPVACSLMVSCRAVQPLRLNTQGTHLMQHSSVSPLFFQAIMTD